MRLKIFLAFSIIFFISGCHSSYDKILIEDEPFCGPHQKASTYVQSRSFATAVKSIVIYFEYNGQKERIKDITKKSDLFLKRIGYQSIIKQAGFQDTIIWSPDQQIPLIKEILNDFSTDIKYSKTKTIICLDPIVVLITDHPQLTLPYPLIALTHPYTTELVPCVRPLKSYYGRNGVFTDRSEGLGLPFLGFISCPEHNPSLILNRGYTCGAKVQYSKNCLWFSPDLDVPPTRLKVDNNGFGSIVVPWGTLTLQPSDDQWVISTTNNQGIQRQTPVQLKAL